MMTSFSFQCVNKIKACFKKLWKCSNFSGTSEDIFGNIQKSSESCQKSSEVAGTFPEIPVMTRWKSHTSDSEKVDRYNECCDIWYLTNVNYQPQGGHRCTSLYFTRSFTSYFHHLKNISRNESAHEKIYYFLSQG